MTKYISVGKILNFHGIKGDAKVGYSKNQGEFLESIDGVYFKIDSEYKFFKIKSIRFHKSYALIKFEGINSINDILPYKGTLLFVEEETIRENLDEDEFLIDELTGLDVIDENDNKVGVVVGVSNNGTNDLITVKSLSKKVSMIPFVKELVLDVNIKTKKIIVDNIPGLIE